MYADGAQVRLDLPCDREDLVDDFAGRHSRLYHSAKRRVVPEVHPWTFAQTGDVGASNGPRNGAPFGWRFSCSTTAEL